MRFVIALTGYNNNIPNFIRFCMGFIFQGRVIFLKDNFCRKKSESCLRFKRVSRVSSISYRPCNKFSFRDSSYMKNKL